MTETVTQQNQETVTKQKNPLRIEQGRKLVEYNPRKKEELKHLNKQITKQDSIDHKPKPNTNTYVYAGGLSVLGLAIGGWCKISWYCSTIRFYYGLSNQAKNNSQ